YAAVDEIREPHSPHTVKYYPPGGSGQPRGGKQGTKRDAGVWHDDPGGTGLTSSNPLGKLPGSVWDIASQPLTVPPSLGVDHFAAFPMELPRRIILGWSPPAGIVLDPFGGTGTTALVASVSGRHGISIDRSADYCRL